MSFFDKFSADKLKDAAAVAKKKLGDAAAKGAEAATAASQMVKDFDYQEAQETAKRTASNIADHAGKATTKAIDTVMEHDYVGTRDYLADQAVKASDGVVNMKDSAVDAAQNFDLNETTEAAIKFSKQSAGKLNRMFRDTLELDKTTFDMVNDVKKRLPTPASSVDDIYEQCRKESIRRAIAAFMLGGILDEKSAAKYGKLTDDYDTYRHDKHGTFGDYSHAKPSDKTPNGTVFRNDYNPDEPLVYERDKATIVSVDHITSRKEIFSSQLLKMGLTDEQLGKVVNDPGNLKYMHRSINSQKGEADLYDWLSANSKPHPTDDCKLIVTIKGSGKEHVIDKKAVDKIYAESKQVIRSAKIQAVKEIGTTVALTGATMAAQQVVGLIVVETIDVFLDELKRMKFVSEEGIVEEMKLSKNRLSAELAKRFEERQIWSRAKSLGIEAGVAGALSVIPQILISLVLKMPSFVYALIRESTLSVVRAIRIVTSNEPDKLVALQVVIMGAASAVVGIYAQRVISQGIAAVPLLNKFNSQVSSVLSGVIVTAVPLAAIYTFEQNKSKLVLKLVGPK